MKRTLTALLLVLTMTLAFSGCTRKDAGSSGNQNDSAHNGTVNGGNGGTADNGSGTMNDGATDNSGTSDLPSGASRYGYGYGNNAYAQPGSNGSTSSDSADEFIAGRSFDEMLRNGRVRDTDGILTDGENDADRW